jgi:hypothetical protein
MTKPNTALGKLSWAKAGDTTWRALGIPAEVPFIAPERAVHEHNVIGSSVERTRFIQQKPRDVHLEVNATTWAFIAYCLQSDPAPASSVRTFSYKSQNVGALIDMAYDDGTIRYLAEDIAVKRVVIRAADGVKPTLVLTLSVGKISSVGADPSGAGDLVDFDTTNEIGIESCLVKIGDNELAASRAEFTIEPLGFEHGNVIGASSADQVNHGNVRYELDVTGYYDSGTFDIGDGATWTPTPTATYTFTVGDTTGTNYFNAVIANPIEMDAEFTPSGEEAVKLQKRVRATAAPTMTCKDAVFTTNRYWTE